MQFGFGSGLLWAVRSDIAGSTPIRFGALQDVTIDFDGELKDLFSQYTFPIDVARGKTKITGKAKFARISAVQFNTLFFGGTTATGQNLVSSDEIGTVGSATPTVTIANGASFALDLGVRDGTTGSPLTLQTGTAVAVGEYAVGSLGVYTFNTAAAGSSMLFDYMYTTGTAGKKVTISNQLMGASPRFKVVLNQQYEGKQMTLILYQAASNKLSYPTKLDDYVIEELDLSAYANSAGQVYEFSASE